MSKTHPLPSFPALACRHAEGEPRAMTESVRARRVRERRGSGPKQMPWRRGENSFRPMEVLSPEQVERIHTVSLKLLAEFGLEFQNDEALQILAKNGAKVDAASGMV